MKEIMAARCKADKSCPLYERLPGYIQMEIYGDDEFSAYFYALERDGNSVFIVGVMPQWICDFFDSIEFDIDKLDGYRNLAQYWPTAFRLLKNGKANKYRECALRYFPDPDSCTDRLSLVTVLGNIDTVRSPPELEGLFLARCKALDKAGTALFEEYLKIPSPFVILAKEALKFAGNLAVEYIKMKARMEGEALMGGLADEFVSFLFTTN